MAVGAFALLLVGVGVGFSLGRATAPKAPAPSKTPVAQVVTETVVPTEDTSTPDATDTVDSGVSADTSSTDTPAADTTKPRRPKQISPANGAVLTSSRVSLHWGKSTDDSGKAVTYSFQIETRGSGSYGALQTFKKLKTRSYSVRVLSVRRRWRVWAVDAAGNKSSVSPWHTFIHKVVVTKTTTKKSTNTTTTEH